MIRKIGLILVVFFSLISIAQAIQCVQYAREQTGILIHGNAYTWWNQASGLGYSRGSDPELRAVLCFPQQTSPDLPYGHVAVVADINSSSEIVVDHANWEVRDIVRAGVVVTDVSGNWTRVTVGNSSTEYTVSGFVYDSFVTRCIIQTPYDWSVCDDDDVDTYLECRDTSLCDMHDLGGCQLTDTGASGTSNLYTQSTDIHITHAKIRPYKEGSWHHEVDVDMTAGQTFLFELEGRVRNKSNYDLEDVDIDYCFVKDDKDFDVQIRKCLDDDQVDVKEGEKESKHTRRSGVIIAADLSEITVYTDDGNSFDLAITQENLTEEEITLYFYLDVETEDNEDRDVSDEAKTDEYAKLEIHLDIPNSPPGSTLNIFVDNIQIENEKKPFLEGDTITLNLSLVKFGLAQLSADPQVTYLLYGPNHSGPQTLATNSVSKDSLNSVGKVELEFEVTAPSTEGDYSVNVCMDPNNYISETEELDNCEAVNFSVEEKIRKVSPAILLILQDN